MRHALSAQAVGRPDRARAGVKELTSSRLRRLRGQAGTAVFDRPRFAWPLFLPKARPGRWSGFHNRGERLVRNPSGIGYDCEWQWTSDLTVAKVFPSVGSRLLRAALAEWPICLGKDAAPHPADDPEVSFIVGHRGEERAPHLLATLASLLGQKGSTTEILVVEQSEEAVLGGRLPAGVRWIHQRPPRRGMPYSRSWAFNRGVREATGRFVVLHDNDILAPAGFAAEVARLGRAGFEAMRLQRFVFYLDRESTGRLGAHDGAALPVDGTTGLEFVRQNCEGHTLAVGREAYLRLGGHDEAFLGWGGEDNEFYDRCRVLRLYPWGYLPFLHLWHEPQPGKVRPVGALAQLDEAMSVSRDERIRRLSALPFGSTEGPILERTV